MALSPGGMGSPAGGSGVSVLCSAPGAAGTRSPPVCGPERLPSAARTTLHFTGMLSLLVIPREKNAHNKLSRPLVTNI